MGVLKQQARDRIIGGFFIGAVIVLVAPILFDRDELPIGSVVDIEVPELIVGERIKVNPLSSTEIESKRTRLRELVDSEGYWIESGTLIGEPILGEDAEAQGLNSAWAVQVASFIKEENAISLRDKLVVQDFSAWLAHVHKDGRKVTRVGVGPMVSLESAKIIKERLIEAYPESIIVSFKL